MAANDDSVPIALRPPDPFTRIRPVLLSDVEALVACCWPERTADSIRSLVVTAMRQARDGRGLGVVVVVDGQVVGYGQLTAWGHCGEISDLYITERYRSAGLGTTLIQYLVRVAREKHMTCVELGAARSNPRALALYKRLGFTEHREIMINLGQGREPVVYLRLNLQ
ncbi:MAG: GNAT family N-acetyltransferase [Chloroflexi bacterium]|nr:MAG: GNAT family N-acetyltransferase [Chloroflexota bacterium]